MIFEKLFKNYPCHMRSIEVIRKNYPEYHEEINKLVKEGKIKFDSVVLMWVGDGK